MKLLKNHSLIFELILSGGLAGQVIIGALALMLAFAIYIYFERLFAIREALKVIPDFMSQIRDFVASGKIEAATLRCAQLDSPVSRLISTGISRIGRPLDDINTAIENAGTFRGL